MVRKTPDQRLALRRPVDTAAESFQVELRGFETLRQGNEKLGERRGFGHGISVLHASASTAGTCPFPMALVRST